MKQFLGLASAVLVSFMPVEAVALTARAESAVSLLLTQKLVQQCAYCALKNNGFGKQRLVTRKEQAFWVLAADAGLQCDFWDDTYATETSSFTLGVPADAIALFHTHPADQARFSDQDRFEAMRLETEYQQGIDFFTLSGRKFGVIDPALGSPRPEEFWFSNSLWLDNLEKAEKRQACDDIM